MYDGIGLWLGGEVHAQDVLIHYLEQLELVRRVLIPVYGISNIHQQHALCVDNPNVLIWLKGRRKRKRYLSAALYLLLTVVKGHLEDPVSACKHQQAR